MRNKLNVLTRFMGRKGHAIKQASPTILTIGGVGALIAAGVMAVRATPKMDQVVSELDVELGRLDDEIRHRDMKYPDDDIYDMKAKGQIWGEFGLGVLKVYGPAIGIGAVGVASILYGHGVMRRREASLIAAYGVLERSIEAYRSRVRESFGPEVEEHLYSGNQVRITDIDKKNKTVNYDLHKEEGPGGRNEFQYEFGRDNKHWNDYKSELNLVFLRAQEKYANHLLQVRGHVLLNDVFDALGMKRTSAGAVTGWTYDGPDGYIDFGLFEPGSTEEQDYFYFFNGEVPILLEFNVDGLVYDKLDKIKKG